MKLLSCVFAVGMAGVFSAVQAQQMIAVSHVPTHPPVSQSSGPASGVLDTRLSIDLTQAQLRTTLDEIAKRSGVRIMYSHLIVPVDKRVTVRGTNITLATALERALEGTQTSVRVTPDGSITIGKTIAGVPARQGIVVGKIVHAKSRRPLSGATVWVGKDGKAVTSGEDGAFRIQLPAGTHVIHVRAVGMVQQSRQITVLEDQTQNVEFSLELGASVLDEVVVTGTVVATERKAITTPVTVITAADIAQRGITNIEQLFRGEIPGVIALEQGAERYYNSPTARVSTRVYSRGSSTLSSRETALKTYIDGVELSNSLYLGTIDPQSIERIEIITGPQAATIYGSGAIGGVMQIFTKKGQGSLHPEFTLSLKAGMMQSNMSTKYTPVHTDALTMTGTAGAGFSYAGTLSYQYSGQWQPKLFTRIYGASVGVTHATGPITTSGSVAITGGRNGTFSNMSPLESVFRSNGEWLWFRGATTELLGDVSSQTLGLNLDYRPFSLWQHHVTVGRNQNDLATIPMSPALTQASDSLFRHRSMLETRKTMSYNTTVRTPGHWLVTQTLTIGGNWSSGSVLNVQGATASKTATAYLSPIVTSTPSSNWGGFASWQMGLWNQLFLSAAVRGERNPDYGEDTGIDWTPTVGATYTMELGAVTMKVLTSYGRATRPPTLTQRLETETEDLSGWQPARYVSKFANSLLRPEYARGPQGGVELYLGNRGSLTVNHYQQSVRDLIQDVTVDSIYRTHTSFPGFGMYTVQRQSQNVATIRQYGWEFTGSVTVQAIAIKGTYSWNESRIRSVNPTVLGYYPGQSFLTVPPHTGNMTISYARGPFNASVLVNMLGPSLQNPSSRIHYRMINESRLLMYTDRHRTSGTGPLGTNFARPGYAKTDITMSQRVTPQLSATLNVINAGNSFGSEVSPFTPTLGRQTQIGMSFRFAER